MFDKPETHHHWLQQLIGEWRGEFQCSQGPDQPPQLTRGTERVVPLGELWTIGHGEMEIPDSPPMKSIITLGYDPKTRDFTGTWVGSMMTHLWNYRGWLDDTGKVLTLEAQGPSFSGDGTMATYQDIITLVSPDRRLFASRIKLPDGSWNGFMSGEHHRTG